MIPDDVQRSAGVPPVLFLVFNRPATTRRVFEAIRRARPTRLYVAADGPRPDEPADQALCEEVRLIAANIDWACEVQVLARDQNLGCRDAVRGGLDWFFSQEPEGIVLEDDCLPAPGFFDFCTELLARYRHDERIMILSGHNAKGRHRDGEVDYFFSHFGGIWGWASWRRAWELNDSAPSMIDPVLRDGVLRQLLGPHGGRAREEHLRAVLRGSVSSWAYEWGLVRNINSGLAAVPSVNLVENIGFGLDATHTRGRHQQTVPASDRRGPFRENTIVVADRSYDDGFHPESRWSYRALGSVKAVVGATRRRLEPRLAGMRRRGS